MKITIELLDNGYLVEEDGPTRARNAFLDIQDLFQHLLTAFEGRSLFGPDFGRVIIETHTLVETQSE